MSAPHPTAIDTADPAPLRIFRDNGKTYEVLSKRHCRAITEPESEVMPPEANKFQRPNGTDTRPPAHLGADRLAEIATLIRLLTYGEMMELAAGLWAKRDNDSPVTEKDLPGIWHRWSAKHE